MSKKYIVKAGDTLKKISHRFYGTPARYMDIFNASNFRSNNPGIIYPGEIAFIPDSESKKVTKYNFPEIDENEVVVVIEGEIFYGWQANKISTSILELADRFSFNFPSDESLKKFLVPYLFPEIEIYIGNDLIITGHIEFPQFSAEESQVKLSAQGRSKVGLSLNSQIDDVKQYNNQKLSIIAQEVLIRYGIKIDAVEDVVILKANVTQKHTIHSFLAEYVKENALLLYSKPDGDVILTKVNVDEEGLQTLKLGDGQVKGIVTGFDGNKMHSSYKFLSQTAFGDNKKSIIKNPFIDVYKPLVKVSSDVVDIELANRANYLSAFGTANTIKVKVIGWRKKDGSLWRKNENVIIDSEVNYILRPIKFLIVSIEFIVELKQHYSILTCAMPEAYSQEEIKEVYWK